jgi:hypothetical protein
MTEKAEKIEQSKSPGLRWLVWVFAAVGFAGLLAVIYVAVMIEQSMNRAPRAPVAAADGKEAFSVGEINPLSGSNIVAIDINEIDENSGLIKSGGSNGYRGEERRNILLLDQSTGVSTPILPDNSKRINEVDYLSAKPSIQNDNEAAIRAARIATRVADSSDDSDEPVAYYLLEIQETQASDGPISVLVGALSTGKQAIVMSNIGSVEDHWMLSATEVGMLVREKKALYFRVVNIPELKVTKSVKIEVG